MVTKMAVCTCVNPRWLSSILLQVSGWRSHYV